MPISLKINNLYLYIGDCKNFFFHEFSVNLNFNMMLNNNLLSNFLDFSSDILKTDSFSYPSFPLHSWIWFSIQVYSIQKSNNFTVPFRLCIILSNSCRKSITVSTIKISFSIPCPFPSLGFQQSKRDVRLLDNVINTTKKVIIKFLRTCSNFIFIASQDTSTSWGEHAWYPLKPQERCPKQRQKQATSSLWWSIKIVAKQRKNYPRIN